MNVCEQLSQSVGFSYMYFIRWDTQLDFKQVETKEKRIKRKQRKLMYMPPLKQLINV